MKQKAQLKSEIKQLASKHIPFVLFVNFESTGGYLYTLDDLAQEDISIQFPGLCLEKKTQDAPITDWIKTPLPFAQYQQGFDRVMHHLHYGNSFLTNLTAPTSLRCDTPLHVLYQQAKAKYKINFKQQWICFSPETFIQIKQHQLFAFPMKGTIDASLPDAQERLLQDEKEMAEHYTIVDLLRNDMSMHATQVRVKRFRYLDKIHTRNKDLWQMSSEIVGDLPSTYLHSLDDIIFDMLPAGSISGAPKQKTLEIIREAEQYDRGFYTGTAFYFDGQDLDSCVLIRFIEQTAEGMVYKSGGGITTQSIAEKEYDEMIQKVYLPV